MFGKGELIIGLCLVTAAASLLPGDLVWMIVFAGCGCLGGIAAVASGTDPSLKAAFLKSMAGIAMGVCLGFAGMAYFGDDIKSLRWTGFACVIGGILGPWTVLELLPRVLPDWMTDRLFRPSKNPGCASGASDPPPKP